MIIIQQIKRWLISSVAVAITFVIGVVLYYGLRNAPQRLFVCWSPPSVSVNGITVPGARAYRSLNGVWLIDMGSGDEWYAYLRDEDWLLTCQAPRVISLPHSLYLVENEVLPCIPFNNLKSFNPHPLSTTKSIEFDSHEYRGRVKLIWPD